MALDNKAPLLAAAVCLLVFAGIIFIIDLAARPSHKFQLYVDSLVEEDRSHLVTPEDGSSQRSVIKYPRRLIKFPTIAEAESVLGKPVSDRKMKDYRGSEENGWRELKFKGDEGTLAAYFQNATGRLSMISWVNSSGSEYITGDSTEWRKQITVRPGLLHDRRGSLPPTKVAAGMKTTNSSVS